MDRGKGKRMISFKNKLRHKGKDIVVRNLSTVLCNVNNQRGKCHHLSSRKWPRKDEQLHIYLEFHLYLTSFKDLDSTWLKKRNSQTFPTPWRNQFFFLNFPDLWQSCLTLSCRKRNTIPFWNSHWLTIETMKDRHHLSISYFGCLQNKIFVFEIFRTHFGTGSYFNY